MIREKKYVYLPSVSSFKLRDVIIARSLKLGVIKWILQKRSKLIEPSKLYKLIT